MSINTTIHLRSFCIRVLSLFYIPFLILGCSGSTDGDQRFEVKEGQFISVQLDNQTSPAEQYTQYIKDYKGREAYAVHVKNRAAIKIYDLASGELFEEIKIPTSGPEAIRSVDCFYIHNSDSIFLSQGLLFKLLLVNQEMNILKTIDLMPEDADWDPKTYTTTSNELGVMIFDMKRDFYVNEFNVAGQILPFMSPYKHKANVEGLLRAISLDREIYSKFGTFPESMKGKTWTSTMAYFYSRVNKVNGDFILSFGASTDIQVYDNSYKFKSSYYASSKKLKDISHYVNPDPTREQEMEYYMNMPVHGGIYHDVENGFFYRIAKYPRGKEYDLYKSDFIDPMANPRDLCIIVLDKDYKKVAEFDIKQPEDGVYYDMCFANKNGLYIPYVDLNNEDVLYFKNFKVHEKM
ncbi:DUF4221 family protein [Belliella marina]|uniref:DUF4221 family protein n=1 Tax=Belliella marina TaxID=1644146 RepID=A0ABW4VGX2_9BACT